MTRLLLVEDHPLSAEALKRLLERKAGFEVVVALDGPQALELAESARPDAVLLDLGLPGMDGLELARRLRAGEGTAAIPLVALTASLESKDHKAALAAGCVFVETKPLELERLTRKLRELLPTS